MTPEQTYIANTSLEHRRKYAQFFTPVRIAEFMCDWVLKGKRNAKILEPAFGLGIFSRTIAHSTGISVDAYEIDEMIYSYARSVCPDFVNLLNEDYFRSSWNEKYDAIVCNPPYLKFHDYDNTKYISDVNAHLGTQLNGFTNLYTLFLLKSISQLESGGRLAYIVPSEFLNSDYGVEVKRSLIKSGTLHHIIVLDFKENAFDDALTTACIIFCENTNKNKSLRFSFVSKIEMLDSCLEKYREFSVSELNAEVKWKKYYEGCNSGKYRNLVPFSYFAKVTRGIATGDNGYFTFSRTKAGACNIPDECLMPCICKAVDAPQLFFTPSDFSRLVSRDKAIYLFNGMVSSDNENVTRYIRYGEDTGVNKRYLTSCRSPWYSIENRPPAPIWVSVFNRKGMRFVRNEANIRNLTTFHCIYPKDTGIDVDVLFAYLITNVAKDIFMDNSRQYGNGLVKFEPNDLNKGLVADLSKLNDIEISFVKDVYSFIKDTNKEKIGLRLLDDFFSLKFTDDGFLNIDDFKEKLKSQRENNSSTLKAEVATGKSHTRQLTFLEIFNL